MARTCEWCHKGYGVCWKGVCWCLVLSGLIAPLTWGIGSPFPSNSLGSDFLVLGLFLAGAFAACFVLLLLLRSVLLVFFVAKFSLGQFMLVLLTAGLCVSLLIELQGGWKILPGGGLLILLGIVGIYIKSYDPFTRNKLLPPSAREVLFHPPDARKRKEEGGGRKEEGGS